MVGGERELREEAELLPGMPPRGSPPCGESERRALRFFTTVPDQEPFFCEWVAKFGSV